MYCELSERPVDFDDVSGSPPIDHLTEEMIESQYSRELHFINEMRLNPNRKIIKKEGLLAIVETLKSFTQEDATLGALQICANSLSIGAILSLPEREREMYFSLSRMHLKGMQH